MRGREVGYPRVGGGELKEMAKNLQHWHNISQQEKHTEAGTVTEGDGNQECRV